MGRDKSLTIRQAIDLLIEESRRRPIIPFLGSGLSYSSGYPTVRGVIEYLAKLDFAIQFDVYKHRYPQFSDNRIYKEHPRHFIEDFGWPSIGELNADLWNWLGSPSNDDSEGGRRLADEKAPKSPGYLLKVDILGEKNEDEDHRPLEFRDHLRAIVQWSLRRVLAENESGTEQAMRKEWDCWRKWYLDGIGEEEPQLLFGDWDEMLYRLCEGSLDLVDSLFASFERGRHPTIAHRYLAFLVDKLSIPLVFTTNFDSFLERAMTEEGVVHRPFDVHRDAPLPHESLVARQTSVLKLHGSAYGLRVGERLKYPAEAQALESIVSYVPEEPLFLVTGFSGSERRMMQVLKTLAHADRLGNRRPRMLWLEGPGKPSDLLNQFAREAGDSVSFVNIADISTFLQQLFFGLTGGYQASSVAYSALPGRPAFSAKKDDIGGKKAGSRRDTLELQRRPVQIFATDIPNSSWAGLAAAKFAAERASEGYNVIWIDLEKHHTVAGTVSEILQKARQYEPDSPNFTLISDRGQDPVGHSKPLGKGGRVRNNPLFKAADRVHDVLKQGRYVLVIDSVESYGRPQFQHHGIPSFRLESLMTSNRSALRKKGFNVESDHQEFIARVNELFTFINYLIDPVDPVDPRNKEKKGKKHVFHDSFVCVSLGEPVDRHEIDVGQKQSSSLKALTDRIEEIRSKDGLKHVNVKCQEKTGNYTDLGISSDGALLNRTTEPVLHRLWKPGITNDSFRTPEGRLEAFFQLKSALKKIQICADQVERDHHVDLLSRDSGGARDAFLGLLSVFRRPRSIACIRAMTERWGISISVSDSYASAAQIRSIRAAIDGLIRRQIVLGKELEAEAPLGMLHEGGSIWLFRDVQLYSYGLMTKSLRVTEWVNGHFARSRSSGNAKSDEDAASALIDGLIGVALHTEASRVYYADTFMPTHDLEAFYEYLYHRCWSIRTLSLLIGVFGNGGFDKAFVIASKLICGKNGEASANGGSVSLESALKDLSVFSPLRQRTPEHKEKSLGTAATDSDVTSSDKAWLLRQLHELRTHCLTTLNGALDRQKSFLRMSATADTLRGWIRQIELVVLPEISGELFSEVAPQKYNKQVTRLTTLLEWIKGRIDGICVLPFDVTKSVADAERIAKVCQADACFLWKGLDLHEPVRPWISDLERIETMFNDIPKEDRTKVRESRTKRHGQVAAARSTALAYERALRQSTRDSYLDARHRSCALALLARAEYLMGHFRQAQHRLDLATSGLSYSPQHRISRAMTHAYRAELLIYSADDHYGQLLAACPHGCMTWLDVAKELRKVVRAEHEIRTALDLMGAAENLTRWRCLAHLGVAQVQLEQLLFKSEDIFIRRKAISHRQFSAKFGAFEQMLLTGLRSLRATLDLLPYLDAKWQEAVNYEKAKSGIGDYYFEYTVECKVWSLWRQFYVAASYFEGLLHQFSDAQNLNRDSNEIKADPCELLGMIEQRTVKLGSRRWQHWNKSVRFEELSRIDLAPDPPDAETLYLPKLALSFEAIQSKTKASLRKLQTEIMQIDLTDRAVRVMSKMWNFRRGLPLPSTKDEMTDSQK